MAIASTVLSKFEDVGFHLTTTSSLVPGPEALGCMVGHTIGSGSYGEVKAAWSSCDRKLVAIKYIDKQQETGDYFSTSFPQEVSILSKLRHPCILHTHQIVETEKSCFYIMELAANGDLLDYINSRQFLSEAESRHVFRQVCDAVFYCHEIEIAHRDLKCENIMLDRNMDVKLGDFGFAMDLCKPLLFPSCGSRRYAPPEILFADDAINIDAKKADIWSLGVILFAMLTGTLPFKSSADTKKYLSKSCPLKFPKYISHSNVGCQQFIQYIFTNDPVRRPDIAKISSCQWTRSNPCVRPAQLKPKSPKYTLENCVPKVHDGKLK